MEIMGKGTFSYIFGVIIVVVFFSLVLTEYSFVDAAWRSFGPKDAQCETLEKGGRDAYTYF